MRNGRRGHNANADDIHSRTCQTRCQRVVQELAGDTRIAANDCLWFVSRGRASLNRQACCRFTQFQGKWRSQVDICKSTHAICSEQPGHRGTSRSKINSPLF